MLPGILEKVIALDGLAIVVHMVVDDVDVRMRLVMMAEYDVLRVPCAHGAHIFGGYLVVIYT